MTDIGLAQPLLGKEGRLDRIVFKLSEQEATALQTALQSYAPHQPLWLEPISPALDASQLGDALALNLTALSLLAMAVGLFLVFNAQRFVQSVRRPQLAQLIILGMPPRRLLRWLTLEIVILASIGTLLGLLLGSLLALALMGQLTQALADLYGPNPIDLLRLSPASLGKALVIGLLGTLAANLPGWWQLLRQSPLSCERATAARRLIPGNVGGSPSPSCCSVRSVCGGQKPGWAAPSSWPAAGCWPWRSPCPMCCAPCWAGCADASAAPSAPGSEWPKPSITWIAPPSR